MSERELTPEQEFDKELERLGELIDRVAKDGSARSQRQALQSAAQLARLRERTLERRTPEEPERERPPVGASDDQRLEALRNLARRVKPHHCPECGAELDKYISL